MSKRLIGAINLYAFGRRHHFTREVQAALVEALVAQRPDAVVLTGDLTASALPEEFEAARAALEPLLTRVPTLVQAGNHDVYTTGAARAARIQDHFGPWMHLGADGIARLSLPGLTVLGLDPNRPHPLASGRIPDAQLHALPGALAAAPPSDGVMLALHYPILDRRGALYDGLEHGLRNAGALVEVLRAAPRRPCAIVHGHRHHGFRVDLDLGDVKVPVFNPGSSGYAWLPREQRAACFNVYEVEAGRLVGIERFQLGEGGFAPEPGGPYATGR